MFERNKMTIGDFNKCILIHRKLKEKIKGNIFVTVKDNKMFVDISFPKGITYKKELETIPNLGTELHDIVGNIYIECRELILEKFFVKEEVRNEYEYYG